MERKKKGQPRSLKQRSLSAGGSLALHVLCGWQRVDWRWPSLRWVSLQSKFNQAFALQKKKKTQTCMAHIHLVKSTLPSPTSRLTWVLSATLPVPVPRSLLSSLQGGAAPVVCVYWGGGTYTCDGERDGHRELGLRDGGQNG